MIALRIAAGLLWLDAIGFGVFIPGAIREVAAGRPVPIVMGFPAYGGGPFERIGLSTSVPLLIAFLAVCILELAAGLLLWNGLRWGAILALVLVPAGAVFWWGFALPIPPFFAVIRTVLIVVAWKALR